MRIVLLGSSRMTLACLKALLASPSLSTVGLVTVAREFTISYSGGKPVRNVLYSDELEALAASRGIEVYRMARSMGEAGLAEKVTAWKPDVLLAAGWYHMVPRRIREIAPKGALGLHASLLPKYRGGAPLVWAMIQGERETGISLFYLEEGVDTGDLVGQERVPIEEGDYIGDVVQKIEAAGVRLISQRVPRLSEPNAPRIVQDHSKAVVMPQRSPKDGVLDWTQGAGTIRNFIRAQSDPYPGAFTYHRGVKVTIWRADLAPLPASGPFQPGQVVSVVTEGSGQGVLVAGGDKETGLLLTSVSLEDGDAAAALTGAEAASRLPLVAGESVLTEKSDAR